MNKSEELEAAIKILIRNCPEEWEIVGKSLKDKAIPRSGQAYADLPYLYVQKATVVDIMEELGFNF